MFSLDAVLTRLLVVALYLTLPTWPASSAYMCKSREAIRSIRSKSSGDALEITHHSGPSDENE